MKNKLRYSLVFLMLILNVAFANAQFTASVTAFANATCHGGSDGSITVSVANPTSGATLTYKLFGNTNKTISSKSTTVTFTGLPAYQGYAIIVTDPSFGNATAGISLSSPKGATFSYSASSYCKTAGASNPSPIFPTPVEDWPGDTSGVFTSSPAGLSINSLTGVITLASSTAGSYTVSNTIAATGSCPALVATTTVVITDLPIATFSYTTPQCKIGTASPTLGAGGSNGVYSSTAGLTFVSSITGVIDLLNSSAGTYTVTNTIDSSGGCPIVSKTSNITVVAPSVATFSYTASPICKNNVSDPVPTYSGGGVAGTFSEVSGNLKFISTSTGQVNLTTSTAGI